MVGVQRGKNGKVNRRSTYDQQKKKNKTEGPPNLSNIDWITDLDYDHFPKKYSLNL